MARFQLTEQNYRALFQNASDAMLVHDMEGRVVEANRASEKLFGFARAELIGKDVREFLIGEFLERAREIRHKLLDGEEFGQPYGQSVLRKDGSLRRIEMSTSLVTVDGKPVGFQHVARDVTEEKQLQENMHYYVQLITRAQEEERQRLARDLHDDLSQALLLLIRRLDLVVPTGRSKQLAEVRTTLEELRTQAVEALDHVRRYVQNLRPRILDDLGLVAALDWMGEDTERNYQIKPRVTVTGPEQPLPDEVQLLLFRIAQEALTNVGRHAAASLATIDLEYGEESVSLTIGDNGKGFIVPARLEELASAGRLGIMGMAERAKLLQGTLEVKSAMGEGTRVVVRLPLLSETAWPTASGGLKQNDH